MRSVSIACRHPRLRLDRHAVRRVVDLLDSNPDAIGLQPAAIPAGELSLVFLTDAALARLHADFLDDPTITDVITFEGDPAFGTAGEICVSVDAALRQVGPELRAGRSAGPTAFATELTLYLVHGWLHLAGHDDLVPAKKRAMRHAEARALRLLTAARAIPPFTLRKPGKTHR